MKNFLAFESMKTGERYVINVDGIDIDKVGEEINKLPKDKMNRARIGEFHVYQFGGMALPNNKKDDE